MGRCVMLFKFFRGGGDEISKRYVHSLLSKLSRKKEKKKKGK